MGRMKKTTTKYCLDCKFAFYGGSVVCCDYFEKTGNRRNCPVGYCDKYEKYDGTRRRNVIPWSEKEPLET